MYIYHPFAPSTFGTIYRHNPDTERWEYWNRETASWNEVTPHFTPYRDIVSFDETWAEPLGDNS